MPRYQPQFETDVITQSPRPQSPPLHLPEPAPEASPRRVVGRLAPEPLQLGVAALVGVHRLPLQDLPGGDEGGQ